MDASTALRSTGIPLLKSHYSSTNGFCGKRSFLILSMASQKSSATKTLSSNKGAMKSGPRNSSSSAAQPVKLLTRVEQLRLLTKAEKAGLLSSAEKAGLTLTTIEQLGLLSKAEEFGVLSAATNPATASTLSNLSLGLLFFGPAFVYLVPEDNTLEIAAQILVALLSVIGGSAAFAASSLVSNLQKLK